MSFTYIAVAGIGLTAIGQYTAGQEAKIQAEYNARIDEQNVELILAGVERETKIVKENAALNEYRQRKNLATTTGEQVSAFAASGVAVETGSPVDVIADSISNAELEIAIGQFNAKNQIAIAKYNADIAASSKRSSAVITRLTGRAMATSATLQAGGTLLSSAQFLKPKAAVTKPAPQPPKETIG